MSCTIIGINFHIMSIMSNTGKWTFGWFFPFLSLTQCLCKVNNLFRWFKDHHWLNDYDRKKHTHIHTYTHNKFTYKHLHACTHTHTHTCTHTHTHILLKDTTLSSDHNNPVHLSNKGQFLHTDLFSICRCFYFFIVSAVASAGAILPDCANWISWKRSDMRLTDFINFSKHVTAQVFCQK